MHIMLFVQMHRCSLFIIILLSVLIATDSKNPRPGCKITQKKLYFHPKYVQDGDIIIGGIFTVRYTYWETSKGRTKESTILCFFPLPRYYRHLLAFIFAIDEINSNPDILPNTTLGYQVHDSCGEVNLALNIVIKILSGPNETIPNYSCRQHGKLAGVIGDLSSETSLQIANMLKPYGYTQISFGSTYPVLTNKLDYPSFFQTLQSDKVQIRAIVELLKHYEWTWIGVISVDDDSGESQTRELERLTTLHGICIEFILKTQPFHSKEKDRMNESNRQRLIKSTSRIIVVCGSVSLIKMYVDMSECGEMTEKTLIIPASWTVLLYSFDDAIFSPALNGSLVFTRPSITMPKMRHFFENITLATHPDDILLEDIWTFYFDCETNIPERNGILQRFYNRPLHKCSKDRRLTEFGRHMYNTHAFGTPYQVYKSVYALAHALNNMEVFYAKNSHNHFQKYNHKLQNFLRGTRFKDPTGEHVYVNENGEIPHLYHIRSYLSLSNWTFLDTPVGIFNSSAAVGEQLTIVNMDILWKYGTNEIPRSRCSEDCLVGQRRVHRKGKHRCCFECVQCSEGEISDDEDGTSCIKCPDDEQPNEKKDKCIKKLTEYLSYDSDPITIVLSTLSILLCVITSIILGIFTFFWETPMVKANNRNLSFVLLGSIMLSFLCVFLFLGRPVDITCMLRQTSFGIIFSIAISSLLAKTIMVSIAFKATKPSSKWRKGIGVKIPNSVVFICSLIMILICVTWLSVSPPYQEMNTHSYPGKIIIQCNEGSVVAFYTVLGYMGFLAAVSFIVAFFARKLPDIFNEAKYITFSMLVFCNVWISFIPAYMSVMGKNTVIVEVFAILASSAGVLFCIFFPKCYIIVLKPNRNTKKHLLK